MVISMVGQTAQTAPQEGDFASALRAAIEGTGLTLDRIRYRLRQRGVPVTVTSLSYWQSGRRRPERPESLTALAHLEQVLGMAAGSLIGLLGPPRPRGRGMSAARAVPLEKLWPDQEMITSLLYGMYVPTDTGLKLLSLHDRVELAPDRGQRRIHVRQIMQAEQDGVDRWVTIYDIEHPGQTLPKVVPLRSCTLGRVAENRHAGVLVTEWLFERPLDRGETLIMEFELRHSGPPYPRSGDSFFRRLRQPARQYLAELQFDPAMLPAYVRQYRTKPDGTSPTQPRDVAVSPSGHVHVVRLDIGPGALCLDWGWSAV